MNRGSSIVGGIIAVAMGVVVVGGIVQATQGGNNSLNHTAGSVATTTVGALFSRGGNSYTTAVA